MWEGKICGKVIRFSDESYKALVSRFNPKRLDKLAYPDKLLDIKCQLCTAYKTWNVCNNCPLAVFEKDDNNDAGCSHVLRAMLGDTVFRTMTPQKDNIQINGSAETARKYFEKIQEILATFKKVNK